MAMKSSASSSPSDRRSERARYTLPFILIVALAACDALQDDDPTFHVRAVNLVADSPALKVYFGETAIASASFNGGTSFTAAQAGSHNVNLKVVRPPNLDDNDENDAEEMAVGVPFDRSFSEGKDYTLLVYGTLGDPQVVILEATGQRDDVAEDTVVWQIANVAPRAQAVDVYITAPEASIASPRLVATLSPSQYTDPMTLTLQPDPDAIDEDAALTVDLTFELRVSGTDQRIYVSPTITVTEQNRVLLAIADNTAAGPSPVKLLELLNDASTMLLQDTDDVAAVRFVHSSRETPPLDIVVGAGLQAPIAQNVGFRSQSPYTSVENGEIGLIARPTGDPDTFAFIEEFLAFTGQSYSAYAAGTANDVDAVVLTDDRRSVPTQIRVRFLQAAPSLEDELVDVYVLLPGGQISFPDDDDTSDDTLPRFSDVDHRAATDYLTIEGGSYDVYFVRADSTRILLGPVRVDIPNGTNRTLVLTDSDTGQLELLPIDDTPTT